MKDFFLKVIAVGIAVALAYCCLNIIGSTVKTVRLSFLPKCEGIEDNVESFNCWKKRARVGEDEAQFQIGTMYYDGRGVARDYTKAAEWFTKAADQGHKKSQFILATMHLKGLGTEQNIFKSIQLLEKSTRDAWWRK